MRIGMNRFLAVRLGQAGVTLVELITALVISAIAVSAILMTYLFAQKLVFKWSDRAELVSMAVGIEKALRREAASADSLRALDNSVEFYCGAQARVLEYGDGRFTVSGRPYALNKAEFKLVSASAYPATGYTHNGFVQWHCRLSKKGKVFEWMGGNRTGLDRR